MKRILGLILVCCLVFSVFAEAFAAPKWEITEQTKAVTNEKKKTVTITVKVKPAGKMKFQWVFVDPENPERTSTGKKITKDIKEAKGLKLSGVTSNKLVLSKIPEALNGWKVYCHLYSNAYSMDSEPVVLVVPGMEPPETPDSEGGEGEGEGKETADTKEQKADGEGESEGEGEEEGSTYEYKDFTVSANGKYLFKVDSMGNIEGDKGVSSLTFTDSGSVAVKSEEPFKSWTVNGIRFEPEDEITGFKMFNLSDNTSISLKTAVKTVSSAKVDESTLLTVTCKGCSFTYAPKGLKSVKEGQVPSGAVIYVFADSSEAAANGYVINGGEPQNAGSLSMQVTVTEDMEIVVK